MSISNHFDTLLIHGGSDGDSATGAVNVPVYLSSTFKQKKLGGEPVWEYARTGNPTRASLEKHIAQLEEGDAGYAFASGMAAITAVLSIFSAGDTILVSGNVYGGTYRVIDKIFKRFSLNYELVESFEKDQLEKLLSSRKIKAVWVESPTNPLLQVADIEALSEIAHKYGALLIVDNTFMTPYLQKPIKFGADIVVHSATKYLGGHSDLIAGLVVTNRKELSEQIQFIQNSSGAVLPPFDSYLLERSIKTLAVRLDRHVHNTELILEFLRNNKGVSKIFYPGENDSEEKAIQRKQARNGGAMVSFELAKDADIQKFFSSLRIITLAESLGGVESLVCHPATMTHAAIPKEIREKLGITDNLIRLSVGIENVDDLIADLDQAIQNSRG